MIVKRVLCRERLRRVPPQFNWVDHRLVQDKRICHCSAQALALYLFLVIVADAEGLSYYSDGSISRMLPLDGPALACARQELIAAQLIAYQKPLYQVLSLDAPAPPRQSQPLSIGEIFKQMKEPQQ
jgi:hypothetical protein